MKKLFHLLPAMAGVTVLMAASPTDTPAPAAAAPPAAQSDDAAVKGASSGRPAPAPATQSSRDDAATIEDDPIIAPDANQSADNNVTFPVDI